MTYGTRLTFVLALACGVACHSPTRVEPRRAEPAASSEPQEDILPPHGTSDAQSIVEHTPDPAPAPVESKPPVPEPEPPPPSPEPSESATTDAASTHEHTSDAPRSLSEKDFLAIHELPESAAPAPRGETIDLGNGRTGYLSLPIGVEGPVPGIVLIHEWWGLNRHIRWWADRLAAEGYAVIAVDLYGGVVTESREEASKAVSEVDDASALATMRTAHQRLRTDERIRAPRTASIGWGFGGGQALSLALGEPELDAVVTYYGNPIVDADKLAKSNAELLAMFGSRDKNVPPETVEAFRAALEKTGNRFVIRVLDAEGAFANPLSARYDEGAAAQAWDEVRTFLKRTLTAD